MCIAVSAVVNQRQHSSPAHQAVVSCTSRCGILHTRMWYPAHQDVVSCKPKCGVLHTKMWYSAHQDVVSCTPGCGILQSKMWYPATHDVVSFAPGCGILQTKMWCPAHQDVVSCTPGCGILHTRCRIGYKGLWSEDLIERLVYTCRRQGDVKKRQEEFTLVTPTVACSVDVMDEVQKVLQFHTHAVLKRSRDRSVGIAMSYGLEDSGSIPGSDKFFPSPQRPDRLWGPPNL
jgi:hypothetical protein